MSLEYSQAMLTDDEEVKDCDWNGTGTMVELEVHPEDPPSANREDIDGLTKQLNHICSIDESECKWKPQPGDLFCQCPKCMGPTGLAAVDVRVSFQDTNIEAWTAKINHRGATLFNQWTDIVVPPRLQEDNAVKEAFVRVLLFAEVAQICHSKAVHM